jgi:HD-like signal output (HDOD) protein
MEPQQSSAVDHEIAFFKGLCGELAAGKVELPTFPDIAIRVKKALDDPACAVDKVAKVVSTEPILSASLIKMANSAAFSRGNKPVSDLKAAITRVGFDMARNTTVSIAIKQAFNPNHAKHLKVHLERIWRHSLKVSAIAYVLPNKPANINPDEAMLLGLLHDIGKFYILIRADNIPELFHDEASLTGLMELWHTGIGKVILESWGFSDAMAIATDEHETLDQGTGKTATLTDVLIVANLLSYVGEASSPYKNVNFSDVPAFERMRIDPSNIMHVLNDSKEHINSMMQALN